MTLKEKQTVALPSGEEESISKKPTWLLAAGPSVLSKDIGFFVLFMLSRAIHPLIIDESKTMDLTIDDHQRKIRYSALSTVIVMNVLICAVMQLVALWDGGLEQWRSIWQNRRAWQVFTALGVMLALGDWLEMLSMGGLSGSVYQILLQSKFIVTAVMMRYITGTRQTRLQWTLLTSLMSIMSLYMSFAPGGSGSSSSISIPWFGMAMAVLKVVVSCMGAVMSDKYMKDLKDLPTHVQLVQMGIPRLVFTLLLSCGEAEGSWDKGVFHNWDVLTLGVSVSFVVKSVSTLYLLAALDALHKNIGEALAILFIYAWEIGPQILCVASPASLHCDEYGAFDVTRLFAVSTIVTIVGAYLQTKVLIENAKKQHDASLKVGAGEAVESVTVEAFQRLYAFNALAPERCLLPGRCRPGSLDFEEASGPLEVRCHSGSDVAEGPERVSLLADLGRSPCMAGKQFRFSEMAARCRGGQPASPDSVRWQRCITGSPPYHCRWSKRARLGSSMTP